MVNKCERRSIEREKLHTPLFLFGDENRVRHFDYVSQLWKLCCTLAAQHLNEFARPTAAILLGLFGLTRRAGVRCVEWRRRHVVPKIAFDDVDKDDFIRRLVALWH